MDKKEMKKFLDSCPNEATLSNQSSAILLAGKMISDALNRQAEVSEKMMCVTMKMANVTIDVMEKMHKEMDKLDDGDKWKRDED